MRNKVYISKKGASSNILLFLKRLFRYTPAHIVIFIVVAGLAGYLVYSKETKMLPLKTDVCRENNKQVLPGKHVDDAVIVKKEKQYTAHKKPETKEKTTILTLSRDAEEQDAYFEAEDQQTQNMEELSAEFEEKAVHYTDAEKIRVESKGIDKPGYVAFMCSPDGFRRGIPQVMKEVAEIYLEIFPDAPRVHVSLVISGGVRGQETFLRDAMQ